MTISAAEFKAKCLSLIDKVQGGGDVVITKRGRVVARLIGDLAGDERPCSSGSSRSSLILTKAPGEILPRGLHATLAHPVADAEVVFVPAKNLFERVFQMRSATVDQE